MVGARPRKAFTGQWLPFVGLFVVIGLIAYGPFACLGRRDLIRVAQICGPADPYQVEIRWLSVGGAAGEIVSEVWFDFGTGEPKLLAEGTNLEHDPVARWSSGSSVTIDMKGMVLLRRFSPEVPVSVHLINTF